MQGHRVVITGIGAVTPIGTGPDGLWAGVRRSQSAARPITRFDASHVRLGLAAEVHCFDPLDSMDRRRAQRLDRFAQFSIAASAQALTDGGFPVGSADAQRGRGVAVYLGSALGGVVFGEEQHGRFLNGGMSAVHPALALAVFGGAGASNVAMEFGFTGPAMGNANSCASGVIAIGEAFHRIRSGEVKVALAGGAEAPLGPLTFGAFSRIGALTQRNGEPERACRPFDCARDGFLMGEGAAMLLLESAEAAEARGAEPYAEVAGYGATNDAYHMTAPLPSGAEAARAMALAMDDARVGPRDIGYVNAHATGTPLGDAAEAKALRLALGSHADRVLVSSTKSLHGHALGATGAMETAISVLAMNEGWLPPTVNLEGVDADCDLYHVPASGMSASVDTVLKNAFGFGGSNACLVLRRWR